MFRARSMPFLSRSPEGVHSLRRTRRTVDSRGGPGSVFGASLEPAASWNDAHAPSRGSRRRSPRLSPSCQELSNRCSTGLRG